MKVFSFFMAIVLSIGWLGTLAQDPSVRPVEPAMGLLSLDSQTAKPAPSSYGADRSWMAKVHDGIVQREYFISRNAKGLQAPNRAQGLRTYFDANGIQVQDRSAKGRLMLLELSLRGLGREIVRPLDNSEAQMHFAGNRVEIRRQGLVEWYQNDKTGLEQGFTLEKPPAGEGELRLEIAVAHAEARMSGDSIVLVSDVGRRLRYSKLEVTDSAGRQLESHMQVPAPHRIILAVNDASAVYPIVIDPLLSAEADATLECEHADADFGFSVASAGDINDDGYADVITGARNYDDGEANEGAVFLFLGSADGLQETVHAIIQGDQPDAEMGYSVSAAGDVNGDGFGDVIVGAKDYNSGTARTGAAFVYLGGASGIASGNPGTAHAMLEGDRDGDQFGWSVSGAGDVDGDGYADVIIGATGYDNGEMNEGGALIFLGGATGIESGDSSVAHAIFESNRAGSLSGWSVASAGDINDDGFGDLLVGSPLYANGHVAEGAAFILLGSAAGVASGGPAGAHTLIEGNQTDAYLGNSVASAGDVNGDGYGDVIVGAYSYSHDELDEGAAFIFLGSAAGITAIDPSSAHATLESNQGGATLGSGVSAAGDVNGDGYGDVIVGAASYDNDGTDEGAAFIFLGGPSGVLGSGPTSAFAILDSDQDHAQFGLSVAAAGDVNGDGFGDVLVGANRYTNGETHEGAAFAFHGNARGVMSGTPVMAQTEFSNNQDGAGLGYCVASAGDVNGDGYSDVAVGAPRYDNGEPFEGAVFVYLGSRDGLASDDLASAHAVLDSNQEDALFGVAISASDVNGDGFSDLIVGALGYNNGQEGEGAAFIFLGSASGLDSGNPSTAHAIIESNQDDAQLGWSVASAGDVNGDGYGDVIAGALGYQNDQIREGAAMVFLGSVTGMADGNPANAHALIEGDQEDAGFGFKVASAGDVNGDGYSDVIVGAPGYSNGESKEGAALIFLGGPAGITGRGPDTADAVLESNQVNAQMGSCVASAGDVDNDGFDDVIVAARYYDNPEEDEGAVFAFIGSAAGVEDGDPTTAIATFESDLPDSNFGASIAAVGDLNGDGQGGLIIGAPNYDNGQTSEGAAFIYLAGHGTGGPSGAYAIIESNQQEAWMGASVASAGDVNGDGFGDVIIGAPSYGESLSYQGSAFVYLGNGGAPGRPVMARQWRSEETVPVQPLCRSGSNDSFSISMQAYPMGSLNQVKLQVEACPAGSAWEDPTCTEVTSADWTAITAADLPDGVALHADIDLLATGVRYRWRARVLYGPEAYGMPGITMSENPAHGPWNRLYAQPNANDITTLPTEDVPHMPGSGGGGGGGGGCYIQTVTQ